MYRTLIRAEQLQPHLEDDRWVVLDARFSLADPEAGRRAYAEGHIPGAHYVDLERQLSSAVTADTGRHPLPDLEQLARWFGSVGIGADTQVVLYDDMGGAMAARGWWLLQSLGHQAVAVLDGGLTRWQALGLPLTTDSPAPRSASFEGRWQPEAQVGVDKVRANLDSPAFQLVDARAAERYRGEQEPIDPVAGHVPGALNRPMSDNLDADGCFKPVEQLRDEWKALLGETAETAVVHMCGSGVTACHNQLAMEHAGLSGSRVYPGSWSEWIRDPQRPVATGES